MKNDLLSFHWTFFPLGYFPTPHLLVHCHCLRRTRCMGALKYDQTAPPDNLISYTFTLRVQI